MTKKKTAPAGKAIQAKELVEEFDVGYSKHNPLDSSLALFWNSGDSAGYLARRNVRNIPVSTLLEMMLDYRIAIADLFIRTPLLNAPWRIEHPDEDVRRFLTAVWEPLHEKFFRSAYKAIMLGWMPMVKYLEFSVPGPTDSQRKEGISPWDSSATPVIVSRIQALSPAWARAHITKKGKFTGIDTSLKISSTSAEDKADIGLTNTVWVVCGREDAFGDLYGQGRLITGYGPWWEGTFLGGLFMRHCERFIDPPIVIEHPPGYEKDPRTPHQKGTRYSKKAMEAGQALRSGATMTLSSEPYKDGEGNYLGIRKWGINTSLGGAENIAAFETVLTRKDADILLGVLIPPAAISSKYAKETLGGKSMVEILQDLGVKMLLGDWNAVAEAAETWVLSWLVEVNFGADRERPQLVTDGFSALDEEALRRFLGQVIRKSPTVTEEIDLRRLVQQAGLPLREPVAGTALESGTRSQALEELEAALEHEELTEEERRKRASEIVQETSSEELNAEGWQVAKEDIERARKVWGPLPELGEAH